MVLVFDTEKEPVAKFEVPLLKGLTWLDLVLFFLMLLFAIRNTVVYLIQKQKWKNFYLTAFYILTISLAIERIMYFGSSLKALYSTEPGSLLGLTTVSCFYTQAILGLFQTGAMFELAFRLQ